MRSVTSCTGRSTKTRTATRTPPHRRVCRTPVAQGVPQKQGLQPLDQNAPFCFFVVVAQGVPQKQGLQLLPASAPIRAGPVAQGVPQKQGLQPPYASDIRTRPRRCTGRSTKTRTATISLPPCSILSPSLHRAFHKNKDCNSPAHIPAPVLSRLHRAFHKNKDCNFTPKCSNNILPGLHRAFHKNKDCNSEYSVRPRKQNRRCTGRSTKTRTATSFAVTSATILYGCTGRSTKTRTAAQDMVNHSWTSGLVVPCVPQKQGLSPAMVFFSGYTIRSSLKR